MHRYISNWYNTHYDRIVAFYEGAVMTFVFLLLLSALLIPILLFWQ